MDDIIDQSIKFESQLISNEIRKLLNSQPFDDYIGSKEMIISEIKLLKPNYGKLFLGNIESLNLYKDYQIDYVISIIDLSPQLVKNDIEHDIYRIPDSYDNETYNKMNEILDITCPKIENYLKNNKNVLIHCFGGVSRSSTVVINYLLNYQKLDKCNNKIDKTKMVIYTESCNCILNMIRYVQTYRRIVYPNHSFIKLLLSKHIT